MDEDETPTLWIRRTQLNHPYEKKIVPLPKGYHGYYGLQIKNEDELVLAIEEDISNVTKKPMDRKSCLETEYDYS